MHATGVRNIDGVLSALDDVIDESERANDRIGYFAALYRTFTAAVRDAIEGNEFLDGDRMERMDVAFANRYLDALAAYRQKRPLSESWRVAFDAADDPQLSVLQHLYAGLAAHQLFDLAVVAAEVAPGELINDLRRDFDHINAIVGRLMRKVDAVVGSISPWIGAIDRTFGPQYASANKFGIFVARELAWRSATDLAVLVPSSRRKMFGALDRRAAQVERAIVNPFGVVKLVVRRIRARESNDVAKTIRALRG